MRTRDQEEAARMMARLEEIKGEDRRRVGISKGSKLILGRRGKGRREQ